MVVHEEATRSTDTEGARFSSAAPSPMQGAKRLRSRGLLLAVCLGCVALLTATLGQVAQLFVRTPFAGRRVTGLLRRDQSPPRCGVRVGAEAATKRIRGNVVPKDRPKQDWDDGLKQAREREDAVERTVKITDARDLHELLAMSNPLMPTGDMALKAITLDNGSRVENPTLRDVKKLRPTKIRPVYFHWWDASKKQSGGAPRDYDKIIQALLNAGDKEREELVCNNWQYFDKSYFFRLIELQKDTTDERLKEKIRQLEIYSVKILQAAQEQVRKTTPDQARDVQTLLYSMLTEDDVLLWPPYKESWTKLAEEMTTLAKRANHDNAWFENMCELLERYGDQYQKTGETPHVKLAEAVLQRLVSEWLRYDTLWEETKEGQFLFRLMLLRDEQWASQLALEEESLDIVKVREEIKIISENRVINLPVGSKLQVYVAKYLQGLLDFCLANKQQFARGDEVTVPTP